MSPNAMNMNTRMPSRNMTMFMCMTNITIMPMKQLLLNCIPTCTDIGQYGTNTHITLIFITDTSTADTKFTACPRRHSGVRSRCQLSESRQT